MLTQHGFYSIVKKQFGSQVKPYQIRSRSRKDLDNLLQGSGIDGEIIVTKTADYRYRVVASKEDVGRVMTWQLENLNYDNFKGRIGQIDDQKDRSSVYGKIWHLLFDHFQSEK